MVQAGKYRHRVTIQYDAGSARSDLGAPVPDWQDLAEVWGRVKFLKGREFFEAQQISNQANAQIEMRYRSDVTAEMQVVWGSHTFEIVAPPIEDARQRELVLMCREVT